jgi:hypothetical protein
VASAVLEIPLFHGAFTTGIRCIVSALDSNLRVGETFDLRGRRWIVSSVDQIGGEDFDRRAVAREAADADVAA